MKFTFYGMTLGFLAAAFFVTVPVSAQKKTAAVSPVIFVVLNDGKWIDPIAVVNNGKLAAASDDEAKLKTFGTRYYKPRSSYPLIFGGAADGVVTVVKSNIGSECGGPSADVTFKSTKVKPAGLVMPLASNVKLKPGVAGFRRRPTPEERTEIEKLVRSEFTKNGASADAVKVLRYQNFTAVDVEGDDVADFVGSFWIAPTATERRLLFFIAEQKVSGDSFVLQVFPSL